MTLGSFIWHMLKINTHACQAHHKYAFVPLQVEMGPGNILNVALYISISRFLALCGSCTQQEGRSSVYEECAPWMQHSPHECEVTKG